MKLKKFAAALTAGALTLSLAAPALAVEAADARLAKVTLAVKAILDISDEYTEFYGEPDETALGTRWSLSWDSDDEQLRITATDEGKVVSLNRWEKGSLEPVYASQGDRGRKFPPMTMLQAKGYAQAFLDRVLADNEAVVLEENSSESLSATSYTFQGDVKLNGLASPMSVSVRVRLSDDFVNIENIENVVVEFDIEGLASTYLNLNQFYIVNEPSGFTVNSMTQSLYNVKIIGEEKAVKALKSGDFMVTIDLSDRDVQVGQYEVPVNISAPTQGKVWALGAHTAVINIQ